MVDLLTVSHGNQPTKYSMSDNDAIANSKKKKKKESDGEGLSVIIFLCSHLSLYLYDDEKKMNKSTYRRIFLLYKEDVM
jgi:hypothetical protein